MPTMYELTADYKTVLEMMYDTEIDPQAITDTLEYHGRNRGQGREHGNNH